MIHTHSDRKIKTCPVCQKNIKEIIKAGKELDRLGIWNLPKKIKEGEEYVIWRRKEENK